MLLLAIALKNLPHMFEEMQYKERYHWFCAKQIRIICKKRDNNCCG